MEISTVIIICIIIFVVFRLFKNVNPENKTDEQLRMMYNIAMKRWHPLNPKSKDLILVEEEMKKRGLFLESSLLQSEDSKSSNINAEVSEAISKIEKNGFLNQMQELANEEIPEKIFNKTLEIARIKGITEEEASNFFTKEFDASSLRYRNMGLSQLEADKRAMYDAISMKVDRA